MKKMRIIALLIGIITISNGVMGNMNYSNGMEVYATAVTTEVKIVAGENNTLMLREDGTVWAWGSNSSGELGNNTTINSEIPVEVLGLSNVIDIDASVLHNIALCEDGTVWTWGSNGYGQIGNGTRVKQLVPYQIEGIINAKSISAGRNYSTVVKEDGTVWTWGSNSYGQLGDGTTTNRWEPVQVSNITGVNQVASGDYFNIALMEDGSLYGWGPNNNYQLGINNTTTQKTPVKISGVSNVKMVVAEGDHVLALLEDGTVWSWGYNNYGQIGRGNLGGNQTTPLKILDNIAYIEAGEHNSYAITDNHKLLAWGRNQYGQIGDGTTVDKSIPTEIPIEFVLKTISMGTTHVVGLTDMNEIVIWGKNNYGQYGTGGIFVLEPTINPYLTDIKKISAGVEHSLALKTSNRIMAWGKNNFGQLGDGTTMYRYIPIELMNIIDVEDIEVGWWHSVAISSGEVYSWGSNALGQLGIGNRVNSKVPVRISNLEDITQIVAGTYTSTAVDSQGDGYGWGYNKYGELGNNTFENVSSPEEMYADTLIEIQQIELRYHNGIYISNGEAWCWGRNYYGQLGIGNRINKGIPVLALSGNVIDVSAGNNYSIALKSDGTVWSWGHNRCGQLGDGTKDNSLIPIRVIGLPSNIIDIEAGRNSSFAIDSDGNIWSWGDNGYGQLGDGTRISRLLPVKIKSPDNISQLSVGDSFTLARTTEGNVYAWGGNANGILGLGYGAYSYVPLIVELRFPEAEIITTMTTQTTINTISASLIIDSDLGNNAEYTFELYKGNKIIASTNKQSEPDHTFDNLPSNTTYELVVTIYSGSNLSDVKTKTVCTKLPTPSLTGSNSNTDSITIILNNNEPMDTSAQYQIICGNSYVNAVGQLVSEPTWITLENNQIDILDLEVNQAYGVKARAKNKLNELTPWSEAIYITLTLEKPTTPTTPTLTTGEREVVVKWDLVAPDVIYELEVDGEVIKMKYDRAYSHKDLNPNTTHKYRVRSYNKAGYSTWTPYVDITTAMTEPTAVTNITATSDNQSVTLLWDYDPNNISYQIIYNGMVSKGIDKNYNKIYGLQPKTTYTYQIKAINSLGETSWSAEASITTKALATPEVELIEIDTNYIELSWQSISNAVIYRVTINNHTTTTADTTIYFDDIITDNTAYNITVQAINGTDNSALSNPIIVETPPTKPATVNTLMASALDRSITLYWENVENTTSFDVLIDSIIGTNGKTEGGILIENGKNEVEPYQTFLHDFVLPYTIHTYRVRGSSDIAMGDWSDLLEVTSLAGLPVVPKNIYIDTVGTITSITWDEMQGATGYEIYVLGDRYNEGIIHEELITVTDPGYIDRGTDFGVETLYQIRAINEIGAGDWSGYIVNSSMRLTSIYGEAVDLNLTAKQIIDFTPYTLNVYYNQDVLTLRDLCGTTPIFELEAGLIEEEGIEITKVEEGHITFTVEKEIEIGYSWEGIINNIVFEGNISGGTTLDYTVFINESVRWEGVGHE